MSYSKTVSEKQKAQKGLAGKVYAAFCSSKWRIGDLQVYRGEIKTSFSWIFKISFVQILWQESENNCI